MSSESQGIIGILTSSLSPERSVGEGHGDGPLLPGAAALFAPVHRPRPAAHPAGPADRPAGAAAGHAGRVQPLWNKRQ